MLFRLSISYFAARALPLLAATLAVPMYTRLLSPEEYGYYAKVMALVFLADAALFQWARLSFLRYLNSYHHGAKRLLSELYVAGWAPGIITLALAIIFSWHFSPENLPLITLASAITIIYSWNELGLTHAISTQAPYSYGKQGTCKAFVAIILGGLLAYSGTGGHAPLIATLAGCLVAPLLFAKPIWKGIHPQTPDWKDFRPLLAYGIPLIPTFLLTWVMQSSDRLVLAWLMDDSAVGSYAVGSDLANFAIGSLLVAVNLAAYPLALKSLETNGVTSAQKQVRHNSELLISLALSGAVGIAVLAPSISQVLVGAQFQMKTTQLLPIIGVASAIAALKAYHLDLAFHLSKKPNGLIVSMFTGATTNIALNIVLIPQFGIQGTAWATVAGYAAASLASYVMGKPHFPLPSLRDLMMKAIAVSAAAGSAAFVASSLTPPTPVLQLFAGTIAGATLAFVVAYMLNIAGLRSHRRT